MVRGWGDEGEVDGSEGWYFRPFMGKMKEIYFIFPYGAPLTHTTPSRSNDTSLIHHSSNPGSVRVLRAKDLIHFWRLFRPSEPTYTSWNHPQTVKKDRKSPTAPSWRRDFDARVGLGLAQVAKPKI